MAKLCWPNTPDQQYFPSTRNRNVRKFDKRNAPASWTGLVRTLQFYKIRVYLSRFFTRLTLLSYFLILWYFAEVLTTRNGNVSPKLSNNTQWPSDQHRFWNMIEKSDTLVLTLYKSRADWNYLRGSQTTDSAKFPRKRQRETAIPTMENAHSWAVLRRSFTEATTDAKVCNVAAVCAQPRFVTLSLP